MEINLYNATEYKLYQEIFRSSKKKDIKIHKSIGTKSLDYNDRSLHYAHIPQPN